MFAYERKFTEMVSTVRDKLSTTISKSSSVFDLRDAKLDKLEELNEWYDLELQKPIEVRGYFWGIDDRSLRQMEIRLHMAEGQDKYHVNILDFKDQQYPTPDIARLENIFGRMKETRKLLSSKFEEFKKQIDDCKTIEEINSISILPLPTPKPENVEETKPVVMEQRDIMREFHNQFWEKYRGY